jgi:hypothetical protein
MYATETINAASKARVVYHVFESVEELLSHCDNPNPVAVASHDTLSRSHFTGRKFADWAACRKAATGGWAKGVEIVERMIADLADAKIAAPVSRKRRVRFDETNGDEVDFDRLRDGRDFWRTTRRATSNGPATLTILVNVAAAARVDHEDILWRGAAAIALTHILEAAGYRVELWALDRTKQVYSDSQPDNFTIGAQTALCLKRQGDPLDMATLVTAVSGWFFRTVLFRELCTTKYEVESALGYPERPNDEDLDVVTPDKKRVLIDGAFSYGDAVAAVKTALGTLVG